MNYLQIIESPNPELPHLGFHRYLPHMHLRAWVQNYWTAQQDNLPASGFTETLYPDGGISLTFSFRNELPSIELKTRQVASKLLLREAINLIGVRFYPGGLFKLFSLDMNSVKEANENPDVLRDELDNIQEKLAALGSTSERLVHIEKWLLEKYYKKNPRAGLLQEFVRHFLMSDASVDDIIKNHSISRRQLERKFQQEIGLSPSQLKQLHRVKLARETISLNPLRPLTDVAVECGFYDQSHFIHQFQKVTDQTPGQYKMRKLAQYFPEET